MSAPGYDDDLDLALPDDDPPPPLAADFLTELPPEDAPPPLAADFLTELPTDGEAAVPLDPDALIFDDPGDATHPDGMEPPDMTPPPLPPPVRKPPPATTSAILRGNPIPGQGSNPGTVIPGAKSSPGIPVRSSPVPPAKSEPAIRAAATNPAEPAEGPSHAPPAMEGFEGSSIQPQKRRGRPAAAHVYTVKAKCPQCGYYGYPVNDCACRNCGVKVTLPDD